MNKITIFSLTLLFALILPLFANAQVTVKGIVTDESGVPLVGVSVRYKELPQVGVTTDIDGKFSIKEMKEGKTLVFSYIGMKNVEHLLKGATPFIKIKMESATSELDQVVVTGYTQTTFKKMTGSVGIISADQLKDQAQPTVDALMQGKIAGGPYQPYPDNLVVHKKYESEVPIQSPEMVSHYGLSTEFPCKVEVPICLPVLK